MDSILPLVRDEMSSLHKRGASAADLRLEYRGDANPNGLDVGGGASVGQPAQENGHSRRSPTKLGPSAGKPAAIHAERHDETALGPIVFDRAA